MTRRSLLLSPAVLAASLVSRRGARGLSVAGPRRQRRAPPPLFSAAASPAEAAAAAPPGAVPSPDGGRGEDDAAVSPPPPVDACVVGGGPAGLLSAIMLARDLGRRVKVYERLSPPPDPTDETVWGDVAKFYLIGLGERGQAALREFGVWDDVEAVCTAVPGRMDWAPDAGPDEGVERIFTDRPVMTQVLPRDKLVGVLHSHILANYPDTIELNYGREVTPLDFDHEGGSSVYLAVSDCSSDVLHDMPSDVAQEVAKHSLSLCDVDDLELVRTELLVASDGTQRTVATEMARLDAEGRAGMGPIGRMRAGEPFRIRRYEDDNQRIYKTVPFKVPEGWRKDLNYSARSKDGRVFWDSLPANDSGEQCAVLLLRKDDELAQMGCDPAALRKVFDEVLPQFSANLDDDTVARVAEKPPSFLPKFRYAAPRLNQGDRTVLLGDSIHTVKPYFGLGANSALEDVQILKQSLESTSSIKDATRTFSERRADESRALVQISRELDRPGVLGAFTFVIPLILDSIFSKAVPGLFSQNMIAMLQRRDQSFVALQRRKRIERLGQVTVLGTVAAGLGLVTRGSVRALARLTGRRGSTVASILVGGMASIAVVRKIAAFAVRGLAPADVLNKARREREEEEETPMYSISAYDDSADDVPSNMAGGGI